jgi:hypothetical protein
MLAPMAMDDVRTTMASIAPGAPRRAVLAGLGGLVAGASCSGPAASQAPQAALWPSARTAPAFPLARAEGGRFLVDAAGAPFLIHGDAAWSLIAQLSREDAAAYLDDRGARGFNTLLVSLIEHRFATHAPANIYGEAPFRTAGDFSTPNEAYFAHAEWVLMQAQERGMLVLLTPAYTGWIGGPDGWYEEMTRNGPEKLRGYGRFLGARLGHLDNIVWVHGGDGNPPDRNLVRAVAEGLVSAQPRALHTAHCNSETAALEYWPNESWLALDTVYSSRRVYESIERAYRREARLPFFYIEGIYEHETWDGAFGDEPRLRRQAYYSVLGGACGQVFGNNPIWHFDGPGIFEPPTDWRGALNSRGAQSMTHLRNLMSLTPWPRMRPDFDGAFLVRDSARERLRAAAAVAEDGAMALVYLPQGQTCTLDLGRLSAARVRWYDPSSGAFAEAVGAESGALASFRPGGQNAAGFRDWVLVADGG